METEVIGDHCTTGPLHWLCVGVCVCLPLDECESVIGGVIKIDKDSMTAFYLRLCGWIIQYVTFKEREENFEKNTFQAISM